MHAGARLGRDAGASGAAAVIGDALTRRAQELAAQDAPFVVATVVRVQPPASVEPGNVGLVQADGTIEGFIGGVCAQHSVRLHSLETIESGMPLLLRILPDGPEEIIREEGAVTVTNPCLSGGAIEVFLEPVLPAPRVLVAGDSPIVAALRSLGPEVGLKVVAAQDITDGVLTPTAADLALVVAAHGNDEIATLRAGLEAGVRYVGLVASRKRGASVIEELRAEGVGEELLDALETPAGLDIGARTPAEVALAITARIIEVRRSGSEPDSDGHTGHGSRSDLRHDCGDRGGHARPRARGSGPSTSAARVAGESSRSGVTSREVTGEAAGEIRHLVPDVETLAQRLASVDYLVDEGLATSMYLSLRLPQPLLLEGEAGVGKTEAGKSLAAVLDTPLIRLQCYDGIDAAEALYEWNYPRQLLSIRLADSSGTKLSEEDLFGPDYLIRRPLLRALEHPGPRPAVLLIDEIDRADDDFEAFLLELLADAAVTIPEIGTIRATHPPVIVLTSNRTRDLHDAVKRRCLYHWIDYPTAEREVEIVRRRVKGASEVLAVQVANAVARIRESDVQKPPGVAEAIDWVAALELLGVEELDEAAARRTLGSVLKYSEDQELVRAAGLEHLVAR